MKKIFYNTLKVIILLTAVFVNSCAEDPTASLQEYPSQNLPAPILSSVVPSDQALAGVTIITITGSNFSADARNNLVYFNGIPGTILNATTTQLTVRVPDVVSDTTIVRIAVVGAKDFSNSFQFKTLAAWEEYYPFDKIAEKNYGIIVDNSNNLYVSFFSDATALVGGIWKITPPPFDSTSKSQYIPKGNTQWFDNFRYGPGGELYGARHTKGIWKLVEGVGPASPWVSATLPTAAVISAIEFDDNQNLWALNDKDKIFKIKQDATVTTYSFIGALKALRIFNGELYVAANKDNIEGVWKIPITQSGDLGTEELYFDLTSIRPGRNITAIAFAADGDMILGLSRDLSAVNPNINSLLIVKPNKSYEELYPGVIEAKSVVCIYWPPTGTSLFLVRGEELNTDEPPKVVVSQTTIRVEMEKNGAPYYGQ
jgi:hypothetical protein